ncbi:EAL domain-containing response regulator [Robbsia andropogonis]|nr:EAL domain-containing response regulator [Robbsia andropogonis]
MSEAMHVAAASILVVEDDPVQLSILTAMLKSLGVQSYGATTVAQAREELAQRDVRTILLDLQLGRENGLDVLQSMGAGLLPRSVILVSGCDERTRIATTQIADALGIHVAGSIEKPAHLADLAHLLDLPMIKPKPTLARPKQSIEAPQLAEALDRNEIVVEFQPKVSFATGVPIGAEALARWRSKTMGDVAPDVFIAVAEASGQMRRLTETILHRSVKACARWRQAFPGVGVAINVSASDIDQTLYESIRSALVQYGVPANALTVEVTESISLPNTDAIRSILTRMRIDGISLSIDDFGTGYGNLASLLRMPFNELKLDRLFVASALVEVDAQRILKSLVALGREMGLRTVAEGVECHDVAERLKAYGCGIGQGWWWAPAMSETAFSSWLRHRIGTMTQSA